MAGVQWKEGKSHSAQQSKARFLHNDKEQRRLHKHSNPHVGASSDEHNFNYRGLDYKGMCEAYDKRLSEVEQGRQSTGKNARTVMQSLCVYAPEGITDDQQLVSWFHDVGDILVQRYGRNMIEFSVHFDEQHKYVDPETREEVMSRVHGHADLIPEVDGKLNCKKFATRREINALNREIHEMTLARYAVPYMDGTGKSGGLTVEQLKAMSEAAEIIKEAEDTAAAIVKEAEDTAVEAKKDAKKCEDRAALRDVRSIEREKAVESRERALKVEQAKIQEAKQEALRALSEASDILVSCQAYKQTVEKEAEAQKLCDRLAAAEAMVGRVGGSPSLYDRQFD